MLVSLLGGPHCFSFWIRRHDAFETVSVLGAGQLEGLFPWSGGVSVVVHEFAHSYVNPAAEPHLNELGEAICRMKPRFQGSFGRTIRGLETEGFVHESLVRAIVIRYLDSTWGAFPARLQLARELKNGLFWMPELLGALETWEAQPGRRSGIESFMPAFTEFTRTYSLSIGSKAALARAGHTALPVLALWAVMAVAFSRRHKTGLNRLLTAGLILALWISLLEYILLGSRQGVAGIVLGFAFLGSALGLMGAGFRESVKTVRPFFLSSLFVLIGTPLLLSATLGGGFCAASGLAMIFHMPRTDRPMVRTESGGER